MKNRQQWPSNKGPHSCEQGFMLLGLIVAIAIIMLVLGIAAEEMAHSIRREREEESVRRANQYVRAIQLFYRKNSAYPTSVKQLENNNLIRYLRQQYVDPLTGKADYRLIPVGQNKTQVKGFFGQPLGGIASTGLGAAAGMQSSGVPGAAGAAGAAGTAGPAGAVGTAGPAGAVGATGGTGTDSTTGGTNTTAGTPGSPSSTTGSASSNTPFGGGTSGPMMGVGSSANGDSILVVNEQTTYQTWEFLYDPRIEKLKAAAALNAGVPSTGAGALGQTPGATGPNGAAGPAGAPGVTNPNPNGGGSMSPTGGANPTNPTGP